MRRPYWISALGHTMALSGMVLVSGLQAPHRFVEGVSIILPPPGTGEGTAKPVTSPPRTATSKAPETKVDEEPVAEKKRPQPEQNIVKEASREGMLPPPKDEVPSLRPTEREPPPAVKPGPKEKKAGGPVTSGPGGEAEIPVGGATGAGSGSGIGVEGGVLGAHAPWYLVQLRDKVASNWRPPAAIGRTGEAQSSFHFRIEPDGRVVEIEAASSADHFQYDIAARRAIEMSSPLPPLPEELGTGSIGITLTFTQSY